MQTARHWLIAAIVMLAAAVGPAFAQGTTSSITGIVVDSDGGVIPGASVEVTGAAGVALTTVTNAEGVFSFPAMTPGTYTVTVRLTGFKTAVTSNVRVVTGNPAAIRVTLEIGTLTETVTVRGNTDIINTQTAVVSATLNADQLNRMPTPTRNALNAVTFLPGVNTTSTNRNATVNGLPESMINITMDGVSNNDNFNKTTDGFFASVTPRQDAVEQVTVTMAVSEANLGGSGGVTINFTTRSGTNRFTGGFYDYWRHPKLNTNYWFNERNSLPKNDIKLYQYGARVGGPIKVPGVYDGSGKAFFFAHYEQLRFPNSFTRTRTTFHPDALAGWFRYDAGGVTQQRNVMDLAAANGQLATFDPQVRALLGFIDAATRKEGFEGVVNPTTNPLLNQYVWLSPGKLFEHQPTVRIDYNIGTRHRLSGSAAIIWAERDPDYLNGADARFPGAPNYRVFRSQRPLYSVTLRSTLSSNLVNEARLGLTAIHGASKFGQPTDPSLSPESFADIGGYAVVIPLATDWWTQTNPSWRAAPAVSLSNSVSWLRGSHSMNLGGEFLRSRAWENRQVTVPTVNLGFVSANDPANFMFTTANFPGASTGQLNNARALYAMLTGRVSSVTGEAALDPATGRYVAFGPRRREGRIDVYSFYLQDAWRVKPTVTLNLGLRYDLQMPFVTINDTMSNVTFDSVCGLSGRGDGSTYNKCAFFSRNNVGVVPEYVRYDANTKGYRTDVNNFGPSVSVAWRPNVQDGWLRTLLGDPEQATIRGGFSISYERQGIGSITGIYGSNPGSTLSLSRNSSTGLVPAGESWPILYSQKERLYPASFPESPTYPIAVRPNRADSISTFAEDVQVANARSWTIGIQRAVSNDMAVEVRYVGTRGVDQWSTLNYNERDILKNGFIDEFRLAVQNLTANNAAGGSRLGSFAFFGPGTGTSPLPIYLAYLNGRTDATNAAAYTGSNWASTGITGDMIFINPLPGNSAADLDGSSTFRNNAIAAGLPANFFVVNPDVGGVSVRDSGAFSNYHALQVELRRRLSRGLSANFNYSYAIEGGSIFLGWDYGRTMGTSASVRHAVKTQWDWTLPVGRGQRFGTDMNPWLDGALGGWSFRGVGRIQARMMDFGNVRLMGMTKKDLQKMYNFDIRTDPATGLKTVYMLPDDVILNTRRAFSFSPTSADGYSTSLGPPEGRYIAPANSATCVQLKAGDCAPIELMIRAPFFTRFDVGLSKMFRLPGRKNIEVAFEVLNLLDNINFNPVANPGSGTTIFQVGSAYTDASNTYDPGGRLGQVMIRFNW